MPVDLGVTSVSAGSYHSLFIKTDGTLWAMGYNTPGQLGDGSFSNRSAPVQITSGVVSFAAGDSHTLFIKTDGSLWGMGSNASGQLGVGTSIYSSSTPVPITTGVTSVATGDSHTLFIKTDGSLWAMGSNAYGQLGDGSTTNRNTPVQIATNVTSVAAGSGHTLFVKADGSLWAMGLNTSGQLGDGTTTNHSTPVQIATDVVSVETGSAHTLFIKTDGSLWAMGSNSFGQLGTDITPVPQISTPLQVATGVASVSAGYGHTLFVKTDGSLWAMGLNTSGQLGDGTTTNHSTPIQVENGVATVSAGGQHTLFTKTDGSLWAMGSNSSGQLGDGKAVQRQMSSVSADSACISIAAGGAHTLFVKADGSLWAMGSNAYGQLGDGSTSSHSTPVQITTGVLTVDAGSKHTLFLSLPAKAEQVISFSNLDSKTCADPAFSLNATASSGLAPTYSIVSGPATINGNTVTLTGAGTVVVRASQAGDSNYTAATDVDQSFTVAKAAATVVLDNLSATYDGTPKHVTATTTPDGLTVVLTYDGSATAPANVGSYTVVGTINDPDYQGSTSNTLMIAHAAQEIAFGPIDNKTYGDTSFTISATVSSSLAPTYSIVSGPATISGDTVTLTAAGTVVVRASQAGDSNYTAATDVDQSFTVAKAAATVSMNHLTVTYDGTPKAPTATTTPGGLTVNLTYDGSDTAPTNAGSYTVVGIIGDDQYAGNANGTLIIGKATQAITFAQPADHLSSDAPFTLSASTDSNLPVTLNVLSGPATLGTDGHTLTLTGEVGTVIVRASQTGNTNVLAASSIDHSFTVSKPTRTQTIKFTAPTSKSMETSPFNLVASATSGLTVTFTVLSGPATLGTNGKTLTLTGAGTVVIQATQSGDNSYLPAPAVRVSFKVTQLAQRLTFKTPATATMGAAPLTLIATASSGLPVSFTVISGPGNLGVDGKTLTFTNAGTVVVQATQPGDAAYKAAPAVQATIKVSQVPQSITFNPLLSVALNTSPLNMTATASSGLPVTFAIVSGPATIGIDGQSLVLSGTGMVTVSASQAGNAIFKPAKPVIKKIKITAATIAKSLKGKPNAAPLNLLTGDYEVLLEGTSSSSAPGQPVGRLELSLSTTEHGYTAILTLADADKPFIISGTIDIVGTRTNPLITAYWNEPTDLSPYNMEISLSRDGLVVSVSQDGQIIAESFYAVAR